jgi:hypothetical protein
MALHFQRVRPRPVHGPRERQAADDFRARLRRRDQIEETNAGPNHIGSERLTLTELTLQPADFTVLVSSGVVGIDVSTGCVDGLSPPQ